jgi:hypothetical protein
MKFYSGIALVAFLAVPAFCQRPSPFPAPPAAPAAPVPPVPPVPPAPQARAGNTDLFGLDANFDTSKFEELAAKAEEMASRIDMSFLQAPAMPRNNVRPARPIRDGIAYDAGVRALDDHRYDDAVQLFETVITSKSPRADGALYWKAYALNRAGKRDDALAAIAQLRRDYPASPWLHDARALEADVKQSSGQPVSPAQETDDDLKLLAINSLMNADPDRAIPLVEGVLKGTSAPKVKDRALFVLAQSRSPQAQQILTDYARGGGNPDLQLRAIQYVGTSGTKEAQQQLVAIYSASSDSRVKNAVLQALMMPRAIDALLTIAKGEKDPTLRSAAIRNIAANRTVSSADLVDLYNNSDTQARREIVNGLLGRGDAKSLVGLARKETDPAMKKVIVDRLAAMHDNKDAMDYMMELLK